MQELADTMTAEEFGTWQVYLAEEPIPAPHMRLHADLMAAHANGALTREDKRLWRGGDFMPDLWVDRAQEPPPAGPSFHDIQTAIGGWFKG